MRSLPLAVTSAFCAVVMMSTGTAAEQNPDLVSDAESYLLADNGGNEQTDPRQIPGDQFDDSRIPGDQFEGTQIPGDQFTEESIPGDQFSRDAIPGDQFEGRRIPGDQFMEESIPGDQFEGKRIPGDQFEGSRRVPGASIDGDSARQRPVNARLIAHFPLDASPDNVVGEPGIVITNSGAAPQPVPGRFGQAYRFGESAVIAAPLDIDFTTYPRITITAWVRLAQEREESGGYILSTGRASRAPALMFSNERLRGESAGRKPVLYEGEPIPPETWTFVAGVWDFEAHTLRLYNGEAARTFTNPNLDVAMQSERKRNQPELKRPDDDEAEQRRYVFIGALDFKASRAARDVAIDDVRIYAGTLDDNAIAAIRNGSASRVAGRDRIGETEKNLQTGGGPARAASADGPSADTMPIDPVRHDGPADVDIDEHSGDVERQTVVFDGTAGPGRTRYTLRASGRLEPVEGRLEGYAVTINPDDTLDGTGRAARGYVGDARDGYYVYGDIESITLAEPGAARVYVNGRLHSDVTATTRQGLTPATGGGAEATREGEQTRGTGRSGASGTLESTPESKGAGVSNLRIEAGAGQRSAVAGNSGYNQIKADLIRHPMHTLVWYEEGDRPCEIEIYGYAPEANHYETARASGEVCNGSGGNRRSRKSAALNSQTAVVREMRVCLSKGGGALATVAGPVDDKRLKGVRLRGNTVSASGGLSSDTFSRVAERSRCDSWSGWVSCPDGQVATGVVQHVNERKGNYFISGLQLICRGIAE